MSISYTAQQVIFFAFGVVWLGVGVLIFMRCRLLQNAYIRRFKHEMDWAMGDPIFVVGSLRSHRRVQSLMRDPQPDPEVEAIRREIYRRFRLYLFWIFGFPVVCIAAAAFLIASGTVNLRY